jgi:hypothetical protein
MAAQITQATENQVLVRDKAIPHIADRLDSSLVSFQRGHLTYTSTTFVPPS